MLSRTQRAGTAQAAIDLGTNSFHLVVARVTENGYEIVTREKEMVRLGHGGGDMKQLSGDAMDRGIAALGRMRKVAEAHSAPIRAVATSAVREAANAQAFVRRARDEAGIDVEVISGTEEARLIYLGVLQSLPLLDRRIVLTDVGGGSTEVLVGEHGTALASRSFKLGAVRLTDRFFPGGKVAAAAIDACRAYVRSVAYTFARDVADLGFECAVVSSGTAETIAKMVCHGDERSSFNGARFDAADLDRVVAAVTGCTSAKARRSLPGLEPERADIIVAGVLILEGIADTFGIDEFVLSDAALREGVLLDTIARSDRGVVHHLRDVSRRGIRALARRCDDDPAHAEHVAALAVQLFDETQQLHGLPEDCRDFLEAAALLANVGLVISHSKHHLHSYYVIRHSELPGLTEHEIEMIAVIARYHRKSGPKPSHAEFAALRASDQQVVCMLAALLRVAIGLDRSHDGRVAGVGIEANGQGLTVRANPRGDADISLDVYTAGQRCDLLASVLGRRVTVTAG